MPCWVPSSGCARTSRGCSAPDLSTENLRRLIGAYFHPDWNHVYSSREAAIADALRRSAARSIGAAEEIDRLLAEGSDDYLARLLDDFGFDDALPDGVRAFLTSIRDQIEGSQLNVRN